MKLHIEMDCDNAAFEPEPGQEAARILSELARLIDGSKPPYSGKLFDANGNRVGSFNWRN